jgi:nucleotide-binding universal stress UspA family protein
VASEDLPIIVAVDGSDAAIHAAREGLALVDGKILIATVVEASDPGLVIGTGTAGGVMSNEEFEAADNAIVAEGRTHAQEAASALGLGNPEIVVLRGGAGPALCELATERSARAIVMGSRGRGGIKRALLGSVSDHVVRNAPCPVVITGPAD